MKILSRTLKWGLIGIVGFVVIAIASSLMFGTRGYHDPAADRNLTQPVASAVVVTPTTTPAYAVATANENKSTGDDIASVGSDAYLRIAGNSDSENIIFLSPDPDTYNTEMTKLSAVKGKPQALYYQMGELAGMGWFGVSNGTKVVVIDKKGVLDPMYQVRIMKGVRDVDADKVGRSGWIARKFISKN